MRSFSSLLLKDEFLMTLMQLRLDFPFPELSEDFGIYLLAI